MRNLLGAVLLFVMAVGCNSKTNKTETITSETAVETTDTIGVAPSGNTAEEEQLAQLYACSMHPEVTGKKGEKCSKCGMDLTEPVAK